MKHAINPKANGPLITPRLDVDIAGSLIKSVLKQPINNVDDMSVIRFGTVKLPSTSIARGYSIRWWSTLGQTRV